LTYDCKSTWSLGLWSHLGLPWQINLTHKLVQFILASGLAMGGLIRMDGLLHKNFCILKFFWYFGTICIKWSKYEWSKMELWKLKNLHA
jgi:hypothetical protein